jgi:gamma-glutamyltranspeptidase/glutathione hydrolase
MAPPRLAIASGNQLGAKAAEEIARAGGNAVDACLASAVMGWVAEPFFASIGGSGFIAIRTPGGPIEVIDGNLTMPLTPPAEPGQGITRVYMDYSDGMYTGIGGGAIGVPGILAAVHRAWERHGRIEWPAILAPAIAAARDGFPFPRTSAYYLSVTFDPIWSKFESGTKIFAPDGTPLTEGETLVQAELAEALTVIADSGPEAFYEGELAEEMERQIAAEGGFMRVDDLRQYEAEVREPIVTESFGWRIQSNPPPAVGGAVLVHMLALLEEAQLDNPTDRLRAIIEAQREALGHRQQHYKDPDTIAAGLDAAIKGIQSRSMRSPSTTHTSSADADGYACSLTESNGYGAGLAVHGMLLNNTLGEEELNPLGIHSLRPGSRCHSNMAPTIATGPNRVVALGSPGADRIVGAIAQTIIRLALDGESLLDAVSGPRMHLDHRPEGVRLCYEPGLPGEDVEGFIQRPYEEIHMYFGAVQAASVTMDGVVDAAHDPRRSGGSALI